MTRFGRGPDLFCGGGGSGGGGGGEGSSLSAFLQKSQNKTEAFDYYKEIYSE